MDAKITLSFDEEIIKKAKQYAGSQGISLSRLMEVLLRRLTSGPYTRAEDFPVSDWVHTLSEGEAEYVKKPRSNKGMRKAHHKSKK